MAHSLNTRQIHLWRIAIYFFFALPGFSTATWISRTPTIRDALGASTNEMGWIIFGLATGSIIGLLGASHFIARFGGRFVMVSGLAIGSIGLITVGLGGSWLAQGVMVFLGLAIFGFGNGICDVAMNVEGTEVEHAAKKSLLTGFHAAFSAGTLIGAIAGAAAIKAGIPVHTHLAIAAVIVVLSIIYLYRMVPAGTAQDNKTGSGEPPMTTRERMAVWKEPRTILIGIVVLGMAFAEGSANDWLPLVIVDGYNVTPATGSFAFGLFVAAMTIGRALGGKLLDRFGRVAVLRTSALLAVAGLLIVIFGKSFGFAAVGVLLWGFGSAFGFPVGLSAAGDNPRGIAARVGAVTTLAYFAFLVGPPVLGIIGESVGLLRALLVVLVGVAIAGLLSHAARPLGEEQGGEASER
ncbi:MFS transporter [Paenibacillus sp. NPDC058174]|uniref:MFS transporter n=1 Tax=Paenibacillus sp. NPDC058174 TaxID=3346366 RepID=UPI0036DAEDC4